MTPRRLIQDKTLELEKEKVRCGAVTTLHLPICDRSTPSTHLPPTQLVRQVESLKKTLADVSKRKLRVRGHRSYPSPQNIRR